MNIAVIGTGFIGGVLGRALADAGSNVVFGSRHVDDRAVAGETSALVFSAHESDRDIVETIIRDVGLRPVYLGEDQEGLVDALFRIWIALAIGQGRGRRLALRLIDQ